MGRGFAPMHSHTLRLGTMRRFNLVFLVVLINFDGRARCGHLFLAQLPGQAKRQLRHHARRCSPQRGWKSSRKRLEQTLKEYLKIRPDDAAAWKWYARLVDEGDWVRGDLERVTFLIHEQALQREPPGDRELERQCVQAQRLEPRLRRYSDAKRHLGSSDRGRRRRIRRVPQPPLYWRNWRKCRVDATMG